MRLVSWSQVNMPYAGAFIDFGRHIHGPHAALHRSAATAETNQHLHSFRGAVASKGQADQVLLQLACIINAGAGPTAESGLGAFAIKLCFACRHHACRRLSCLRDDKQPVRCKRSTSPVRCHQMARRAPCAHERGPRIIIHWDCHRMFDNAYLLSCCSLLTFSLINL